MPSVYIGTSGWHYKHWLGAFYPSETPPTKMLSYYCERFRSVEINNSFYRLPQRDQFQAWYDQSPPGFLFAVKGSRFVSHLKHLKDPVPALKLLFDRASALKEKLGPIVFQLPPKWKLNLARLREFLEALPRHRFAFEFRNPSWFSDEATEELKKHGAAFCIYELAGRMSPLRVTAGFVYVRLHGPGNAYQGRYSDDAIGRWAGLTRGWLADGKDVYIYFDNDQAGYAAGDAARLGDALESENGSVIKRVSDSSPTIGSSDGRHPRTGSIKKTGGEDAEKEKSAQKENRGDGGPGVRGRGRGRRPRTRRRRAGRSRGRR